jgi:hypothetical protein
MDLKPAGSLVTTRDFRRTPTAFNEAASTEEEMDMNMLTAWPVGALNANNMDDGRFGLQPCAVLVCVTIQTH